MESLIGPELLTKQGRISITEISQHSLILLYFSAHWCPPCKNFTKNLIEFYQVVNSDQKNIQVIFISLDRSTPQFEEYYQMMPWAAIPFESPVRQGTTQRLRISGVPVFMLVNRAGEVVKHNCRGDVENIGPIVLDSWRSLANQQIMSFKQTVSLKNYRGNL